MITNDESKSNLPLTKKYTVCKIYRKVPNISVYLAKDRHNSLSVIKSIEISELSEYEKKVSKQEIKIINQLDHPFIIKQKEHFFTKNETKITLHIVMEYVAGGDLSQMILIQTQNTKYLSETLILDWFTQLCLAVKHLHDRKILHRDIKPSNIFLKSKGYIKLGDFGLAKCLRNAKDRAITTIGSPGYLSPEILLNRPYSFKSDIWAMGVTLFELCALKLPFSPKDLNTIYLTKKIPNVASKIPKHYSKELKNILNITLKGDPIDRPQVIQLLSLDIIQKRIHKFLTNEQYKEEFNHTVLKDFVLDKDERKECNKCMKAKQEKNTISIINNGIQLPESKTDYIDNLHNVLISNSNNNTARKIIMNKNQYSNINNDYNTNDYLKENDIIQGGNYGNTINCNYMSSNLKNDKTNTESPPKMKMIKLIKKDVNGIKPSPEYNLETKRKEIEEAIGFILMKDIYLFLIKSPSQLINISSIKSIEENQNYYDLFNYLSEKDYSFEETFKGISKLEDIRKLILNERKCFQLIIHSNKQ